eukprot:7550010-Alexandrium_andersonii.AAC.1
MTVCAVACPCANGCAYLRKHVRAPTSRAQRKHACAHSTHENYHVIDVRSHFGLRAHAHARTWARANTPART